MSENQLYFAPMEGITGSIYRRAHHRIFGGVDRYYAPFIFTNPKGKISKKDLLEIAPEYNDSRYNINGFKCDSLFDIEFRHKKWTG